MCLDVPSEALKRAGLTDRDALKEFACALFRAKRLTLWPAAQLAGLSRVEMKEELRKRGIAIYAPHVDELREELENLRRAEIKPRFELRVDSSASRGVSVR